jgi:hypothetical protein
LNSLQEFEIFEYDYLCNFNDKIYHAVTDNILTKKTLKAANKVIHNYKENLAGDLTKETLLFKQDTNKHINYVQDVMPDICDMLHEHIKNITDNLDISIEIQDMWANYQSPRDFNPIHDHVGDFSFVWYLDIPEEIRTEHLQVNNTAPLRGLIQFISSYSSEQMTFNPATNDILIFRSNHLHQVYPFFSDNIRISVSGNIAVNV